MVPGTTTMEARFRRSKSGDDEGAIGSQTGRRDGRILRNRLPRSRINLSPRPLVAKGEHCRGDRERTRSVPTRRQQNTNARG